MGRVAKLNWPLLAGGAILLAMWLSPLVPLSRRSFSAHMILHLGIVTVASPVLAIGLQRAPGFSRLRFGAMAALGATGFDMFVVWAWHAPALHAAAARSAPVFVLQQASFLLAGLMVWAVAVFGRSRAEVGMGALTMFMTFMHMTMLGMVLALAPALVYAPDICVGAFGFERIEDQRLGGTLMAALGGLPYMAAGIVLMRQFLAEGWARERSR
ncbi:cytochrome c oxidase assembly protein [Aurantimonas sp. HBX-1]|uniref:cytochrome c oxidase assembly protein n=1 Tax=Aurantimonas sp. HBX-1 TaxID=2906072 RepID=UPI001F177C86|nr:cytochrome c oxidase assembly protein [Aurantimonas sp. HBX-1]UIJ71017.1 cytochrome c oxidase assembly protein [Aurantimonas sp. HBX-1]